MKIWSGGQTGIDQMALRVGKKLGLDTGGYAPLNFKTCQGSCLYLSDYGLKQIDVKPNVPISTQYVIRSKMNIDSTKGSLFFRFKESCGTDKSIVYASMKKWPSNSVVWSPSRDYFEVFSCYKPIFVITDVKDVKGICKDFNEFLDKYKIDHINVGGHRSLDNTDQVEDLMYKMFHPYANNWLI